MPIDVGWMLLDSGGARALPMDVGCWLLDVGRWRSYRCYLQLQLDIGGESVVGSTLDVGLTVDEIGRLI